MDKQEFKTYLSELDPKELGELGILTDLANSIAMRKVLNQLNGEDIPLIPSELEDLKRFALLIPRVEKALRDLPARIKELEEGFQKLAEVYDKKLHEFRTTDYSISPNYKGEGHAYTAVLADTADAMYEKVCKLINQEDSKND